MEKELHDQVKDASHFEEAVEEAKKILCDPKLITDNAVELASEFRVLVLLCALRSRDEQKALRGDKDPRRADMVAQYRNHLLENRKFVKELLLPSMLDQLQSILEDQDYTIEFGGNCAIAKTPSGTQIRIELNEFGGIEDLTSDVAAIKIVEIVIPDDNNPITIGRALDTGYSGRISYQDPRHRKNTQIVHNIITELQNRLAPKFLDLVKEVK